MKMSMRAMVALSACCGLGYGAERAMAGLPPSVEFRIVERTGQTQVVTGGDTVLDFAVQARVVNGPVNSSLGGFGFDIVMTGEPDVNGTVQKGLISMTDGTYVSTFGANAVVGTGGMARAYSYLAGISAVFNGNINTNAASFTNTTGNQEIGLVAAVVAGAPMLGIPGIDPDSEGNIVTWSGYGVAGTPTNGDTAAVDAAWGGTYLGTGGSFVDVYRFRYTPTVFTGRQLTVTLTNVAAQVFTQFSYSNGTWGPVNTNMANNAISVTNATIAIGTQGACCTTATGACQTGLDVNCGSGTTFISAGVCSPNPCPQPSGTCCNTSTGACTFVTEANCTGGQTWTVGGSCTPNTCPQPSGKCCNNTTASCTVVTQANCANGSTWTIAGTCTPNTCPLPSGKCCGTDGGCTIVTEANCTNGGTWTQGGSCVPNTCPGPQGRCCNFITGSCVLTIQADCPTTSKVWTIGGTCTPNTCPPSGSCCDSSGGCVRLTQSKCADVSGTWTQGQVCNPNPCPTLGRCCNFITASCAMTLQANCPTASKVWTIGGTCTPNTCPPTGSCCVNGACSRLTQSRCTGSWTQGGVCNPSPCTTTGRCCNFITGSCVLTLQVDCPTASKVWSAGGTCTPNTCPAPGACCNTADGTCRRLTQTMCTGGTTWVSGGVCNPNPCPQPSGRCCNFVTGSCFITLQADCPPASKTWTVGGTCTPNTCPQPGACCFTGTCRRLTQAQCGLQGGFFLVSGTCSPTNPCAIFAVDKPDRPGGCDVDFDQSGLTTTVDILEFMNAWLAGDLRADFNASGTVESADVFDFLNAWLAGCGE